MSRQRLRFPLRPRLGLNQKGARHFFAFAVLLAAIGVTPPELIASTETQVGVTATSNIGSMGKPPLLNPQGSDNPGWPDKALP